MAPHCEQVLLNLMSFSKCIPNLLQTAFKLHNKPIDMMRFWLWHPTLEWGRVLSIVRSINNGKNEQHKCGQFGRGSLRSVPDKLMTTQSVWFFLRSEYIEYTHTSDGYVSLLRHGGSGVSDINCHFSLASWIGYFKVVEDIWGRISWRSCW